MVSSGKLYEANIDENAGGEDANRNEAISFFKSYQGKSNNEKKDSVDIRRGIENKIKTIDIEERLNLTSQTKSMLQNVHTLNFDIFKFKEATEEKGKTTF